MSLKKSFKGLWKYSVFRLARRELFLAKVDGLFGLAPLCKKATLFERYKSAFPLIHFKIPQKSLYIHFLELGPLKLRFQAERDSSVEKQFGGGVALANKRACIPVAGRSLTDGNTSRDCRWCQYRLAARIDRPQRAVGIININASIYKNYVLQLGKGREGKQGGLPLEAFVLGCMKFEVFWVNGVVYCRFL